MSDEIPSEELIRFAQAFAQLSNEAWKLVGTSSTIGDLIAEHLGADPTELPAIVDVLPTVERPNLQLALNALVAANPASRVIGLAPEVRHFGDFSVASLLSGSFRGPSEPVPPTYDELSTDVDTTLRCVTAGIWLVWLDTDPIVIGAFPGSSHGPPGDQPHRVEIFAPSSQAGDRAAAELKQLREDNNVYRGKALSFSFSQYGEFGITFMDRPQVTADAVVLPDGKLASIERHTIGIAEQADELRQRGQHLKRGLLLYGPPGTGKTHTIAYLMSAMPDRTVLVLQGAAIGALGQAAAIARAFPPAMLVIEDVDLIAAERGMPGMGPSNPLMFQLLNEMDGLAPTDDVLFVLTTNRLDMLEPALAARPGRVDHAVEIPRPDAVGRERLLRLYVGDAAGELGDIREIVERTEGVTASFFKELVRRASFLAIQSGDGHVALTLAHLNDAVAELLDQAEPIMRAMLGSAGQASPGGDARRGGRPFPPDMPFPPGSGFPQEPPFP